MLRLFLERALLEPSSGLSTVGMPVLFEDRHQMLFARLANLLADGDGLRQAEGERSDNEVPNKLI